MFKNGGIAKMSDDKITAFVVVYNEYFRINTCLASLYGQVDEVLLFDDGSDQYAKELVSCYNHWQNVFIKAGAYFKIFYTLNHRGSHSLFYPDVVKEAKYQWLFQLDGDEVLHPVVYQPFGFLKSMAQAAIEAKAVAVQGLRINIAQDGNQFTTMETEPKSRLYDKTKGYFPTNRHSVEWVPQGDILQSNKLIIDHVRTKEEMDKDAAMYFKRTTKAYLESQAKNDPDNIKYYGELFMGQNNYYKWGYSSIEEAFEKGAC